MNKNHVYEQVIEYAKANNIKFAITTHEEMCPEVDLNGYCFLDTDTFEIPAAFSVDKAVILCIDTPVDMTPEDTGESYDKYWATITNLNKIGKPQYIAIDGVYVKLMCWCDWEGENDPKKEFTDACKEAVNKVVCHDVAETDLRFIIAVGGTELGITCLASDKGIDEMYDWISAITDWDCRLCIKDKNQFTEHGVRCDKLCGMRVVNVY